jgi:hypothetical protein
MQNGFLTSGLACWNRQVKRAERASGPPVRLSVFTVDDQPQAPETHTPRGLHLCPPVTLSACNLVGLHLQRVDCETRMFEMTMFENTMRD